MLSSLPRIYPLLGFCGGYMLVMLFNPVRLALRDGLRCIARYKRIWGTFVLLGFAYFVFQFSVFTPILSAADLDLTHVTSFPTRHWPRLVEVGRGATLPGLAGVAGSV